MTAPSAEEDCVLCSKAPENGEKLDRVLSIIKYKIFLIKVKILV